MKKKEFFIPTTLDTESITRIRLELMSETNAPNAIKCAIEMADLVNLTVTFNLKGVEIVVERNSDIHLIIREYERALLGLIPKAIGPHPKPVLTAAERVAYVGAKAKL